MKKYLCSAALIVLSVLFLCFQNMIAFAVWSDDSEAGEPDQSYSDSIPEPVPDDSSYPEPQPDPEPEPEPSSSDYEPVPSSSYSEPDYIPPSSDDFGGYESNYSFYDDDSSYDDGAADSGDGMSSAGVVSSVDNDLYDVSKTVDSNELNSSDWKIALDLSSGQDGANDFNFIKNNKSADDENSNHWMLFLGIGLIAAALAGIIGTIVYCVNRSKKIKAGKGKGGSSPPSKNTQQHVYQPKKNKIQKYDTAEIDIDLGDDQPKKPY